MKIFFLFLGNKRKLLSYSRNTVKHSEMMTIHQRIIFEALNKINQIFIE